MPKVLDVKIRRGQLISPWGIGSVMPLPNDESCIIGGIGGVTDWNNSASVFKIKDERMQAFLNIAELRWPPYYKEKGDQNSINDDVKICIPAFRFPNWYYCPRCGHIEWYGPTDANTHNLCQECLKKNKKSRMVPERFIMACENGHIDNLPILEMIHGPGFNSNKWITDPSFKSHHHLIRKSGQRSASLAAIHYVCKDCGKEVSLADIIGKGRIAKFLNKCPGNRPWLGDREDCNCSMDKLAIVQRGGTNVWFPLIFSSIYIPANLHDDSDPTYIKFYEDNKDVIDIFGTENGGAPVKSLKMLAKVKNLDLNKLVDVWKKRHSSADVLSAATTMSESQYKFVEYTALSQSCCGDSEELYVKAMDVDDYKNDFKRFFGGVSLVTKLRETRALYGFTRLVPGAGDIEDAKKTLCADGHPQWLPAIQNYGEGIFIRFNAKTIGTWLLDKKVAARAETMDKNYQKSSYPKKNYPHITAELVLIHTFSHLLINQLSKHCGYGSSSLRERLYVSSDPDTQMFGVLIYTSSGDSEGSLGGLVKQGKPNKLENLIYVALKEALWCSSDPVCIDSQGQGPDSCNLAACHNCALLPETCCETGNRFLDRGFLIGAMNNPNGNIGYFSDFLKDKDE